MLSSKEIEDQIKGYKLTFIDVRDERIEWGMRLPMFVDTFDKLVQTNRRIPSQDQFVKRYFEDNSENLRQILSNERLRTALEARLRRTYPSLVRDLHLNSLLRENGLQASYNTDVDVTKGVDQIIQYKGKVFHIHSYVGTSWGKFGRKVKNRRHKFEGLHIDAILDLRAESTKKVGDFYLYSEKDVDYVIQEMEKKLEK
jgi:hypothetical protein